MAGDKMSIMVLERNVKEQVKRLLRKYGAYWFMPVQTGLGAPSVDFLCCVRGRFVAIETKANDGTATPRQQHTLQAISLANGATFVINATNIDQLEQYLKECMALYESHP